MQAATLPAKVISLMVALVHHECHNPVCKQVSFTYGSGFPALWRHENLNEPTHEWLKHEFAAVPISFFKQMGRCVRRGHLVSVKGNKELPEDFAAEAPRTEARFSFFAGEKNLCFLPESQRRSYDFFNDRRKNYHSFNLIAKYSHLDIFMGQDASRDVFPLMVSELEKTN
jgi:hypothetical protein